MATIDKIPSQQSDSAIHPNDSGKAIEKIQTFLQTLPYIQRQQQLLADANFSSGGKIDSLTDPKHFGKYDIETGRILRDYQKANRTRIKKMGQLTDAQVDSEINSSIISYATGLVLLEDMGEKTEVQPEKKKEPDPPPVKTEEVIKEPEKAKNVPDSTFFVKTKNPNHRLALRKAPSYSKVSKEANEDEDKKGERVDMMSNETLLKVIVPHVGYNCEWHQIEVVDPDTKWDNVKEIQKTQKLYAYAEFIYPRKDTPHLLPVKCEGCTEIASGSNRKTPFPDWPKMGGCDIFYDKETAAYYIVVESSQEGISEIELPNVKKQAMYDGISGILEFYDKESGKDQINRIIDIVGNTASEEKDYFLSERPASRLKFLVNFPKKYFDVIPRKQEFFDNVPTLGGIMPKEWRTTTFNYSEFKPGVDIVIKRFEEYATEIEKWDGQVLNFDVREEIKKLQTFIPIFEKFLGWNEVILKDDLSNQFEIGFSGPCFKLIYVLEKKEKEKVAVPLRVGLECFKFSEPIIFERTMGYVFYLLDIVKDIKKEKRRWISFFNSYTCPLPRIIPSGANPRDVKKVEKQLSESPVKNTSEKLKEDKKIKEVKANAIANRGELDYVGDPLFSCETSSSIINRVKSLKDLYKEVLNKTNVKDLVSHVASCLVAEMTPAELNSFVCDSVLKTLNYDQMMKILDNVNNDEVIKVQEGLLNLTKDTQYINTDPSIKLRLALTQSISKNSICKAINVFDPTLMVDYFKKLIPQKPYIPSRPKVPTISLKDSLPTEDTLREIRKTLEDAIKEAISQCLFMLVQTIFQSLCNLCSKQDMPSPVQNYGDENLNDVFKRNGKEPNDIDLDNFDVPSDCREEIKAFFDDLSAIMIPNELCSLLNGNPSSDLLELIKNLLRRKYPCLSIYLLDTYKIRNMFKYLGSLIDSSFCGMFETQIGAIPESLCEEKDNIKKSLLQGKLSNEEIEKQIQNEKDRNKELLRQLLQLVDDDNALNKFIPPIMQDPCNKDGINTPIVNSIIPSDPPSIQKLNDQVVDIMFNVVDGTFNNDIRGFIRDLIDINGLSGINLAKDKYREIYSIERMKAEDFNESNSDLQYKRLQNPEYKRNIVDVFPSLKNNLANQDNFTNFKNTFITFDYKYSTISTEIQKFLEETKQKSLDNAEKFNKELENFLKKEVELKYNNNDAIKEVCPEEINKNKSETIEEEMGQDTLIRNFIQTYQGDVENIKDFYRFKINDVELQQEYIFQGVQEIEKSIKDYILQFNLKKGDTINQSIFANLTQKIWLDFLEDEDLKKKILDKGEFYDFLKNNVFSDITTLFMKKLSSQISRSPLFNVGNLEDVDFVPDIDSSECQIKETRSLLDIESFKNKTKDRYEKEVEKCKDKLDEISSQMEPIERAGMYSAIEMYVRLFVIENFLRGLFVFSEFETSDLLGDGVIVDFITKRIYDEIKSQSEEFYQLILKCSKDSVSSRGNGLSDPLSTTLETDIDNKKIVDDSDPRWISGESALDFLIKENIKTISEIFDSVLGFQKEERKNLYKILLDEWYNPTFEPRDLDDNNSSNLLKEYIVNGNGGKGNFIGERYIRVCGEKKEDKKVYPTSITMDGKAKFVYGIRLCYIFSDDVNFKGSMFDIKLPNELSIVQKGSKKSQQEIDVERERSYIFRFDKNAQISNTNEQMGLPRLLPNYEYRYIFPLISSEEDDYRIQKVEDIELNNIIENLKTKMISSKDFQMLFKFVFPLQRLLTLSCIYSMVSTSALIPNIDSKFGTTKNILKNLLNTLLPSNEVWWKKKRIGVDDRGGNEKIRQEYMGNITTNGPAPNFASIAMQTIPILLKGLAERQDPCYGNMKKMWDSDPDALMGGLGWGSVMQFMPMNIFPLIGWGPPLLGWGAAALSMPLLTGEQKHVNKNSKKKKEKNKKKCLGGNK